MSISEHGTIDFVTFDPKKDVVLLVMVEERPWGLGGMLLPDLEAKTSTYLEYVTTRRLAADYPSVADKRVEFQLRCSYPPGAREEEFIEIVWRQHLEPLGIGFGWVPIGTSVA